MLLQQLGKFFFNDLYPHVSPSPRKHINSARTRYPNIQNSQYNNFWSKNFSFLQHLQCYDSIENNNTTTTTITNTNDYDDERYYYFDASS